MHSIVFPWFEKAPNQFSIRDDQRSLRTRISDGGEGGKPIAECPVKITNMHGASTTAVCVCAPEPFIFSTPFCQTVDDHGQRATTYNPNNIAATHSDAGLQANGKSVTRRDDL